MALKAIYVGSEPAYDFMKDVLRPDWDWQLPIPTVQTFWDYIDQGKIDQDTSVIVIGANLYAVPYKRLNSTQDPNLQDQAEQDIDDFLDLVYTCTQTALTIIVNYYECQAQVDADIVPFAGQSQYGALKKYWWIDPRRPNPQFDRAIREYINDSESDPDNAATIADAEGLAFNVNHNEEAGELPVQNTIDAYDEIEDEFTNNYHTNGLIICNTSSKGGAGKTTTALGEATWISSMSQEAAQKGLIPHPLKVCVMDLDVHDSQIGTVIGKSTPTILNLALEESINTDTVSKNLIYSDRLKCWFLLSPKLPRSSDSIPVSKFQDAIRTLQKMFDIIILDTSVDYTDPLFSKVAYPMANKIVFVTTLDRRSIVGMGKWILFAGNPMDGAGIDLDKVSIVINRGMKDVQMTLKDVKSMIQISVQKVYQTIDKTVPPEKQHTPRLISAIPDIQNGLLMRVANEQRFDLALKIAPFCSGIADTCNSVLPPAFRNKLTDVA